MIVIKHCHKVRKPETTHDKLMKMANMAESYTEAAKDDIITKLVNNIIKGVTDDPEFKKAYEEIKEIIDDLDKEEEEVAEDKELYVSPNMHKLMLGFADALYKHINEMAELVKAFNNMLKSATEKEK